MGRTGSGAARAVPGLEHSGTCGHLLGDDFGLLARHRDGHYGTPPPAGATESEFVAWLDEMQAEWVGASRRLSPRLITDLLRWTGPAIRRYVSAGKPACTHRLGVLGRARPSASLAMSTEDTWRLLTKNLRREQAVRPRDIR